MNHCSNHSKFVAKLCLIDFSIIKLIAIIDVFLGKCILHFAMNCLFWQDPTQLSSFNLATVFLEAELSYASLANPKAEIKTVKLSQRAQFTPKRCWGKKV